MEIKVNTQKWSSIMSPEEFLQYEIIELAIKLGKAKKSKLKSAGDLQKLLVEKREQFLKTYLKESENG